MLREYTCSRRPGYTLVEVTVAIALLIVIGLIVVQAVVWSLRERQRLAMHYAATEIAANALESARALPIEQLNQTWADTQTLPSEVADTLPDGKLRVTVEPLKGAVQAKRVTAEVRWQLEPTLPARSLMITTVLTGRSAPKTGGEP